MATILSFGPFRLDAEAAILFRGREPVPIGRRAATLLRVLVERPGSPVSKSDLLEAAWPGLSIEESNLSVQIAALRKVLAEEPGGDRWIETLSRRGYRFVGPKVESRASEGNSAQPDSPSSAGAPEKPSIAVLPLAAMSDGGDVVQFGDGLAEDVTTALSRSPGLLVVARNSSFAYRGRAIDIRQVGRELGAKYLVEGSVRRAGERLRVVAQLINADDGSHVWADRFDCPVGDDVLRTQDRLTYDIVTAIRRAVGTSSDEEGATSPSTAGAGSLERRQVTVMICDVLGLAPARLDPEDLREVMTACHGCVSAAVHRHGGSLAQYAANGFLAYFGYPQAHEDDGERAVRAGLEVIAAVAALRIGCLAEPLRPCVGIATGSAVLGDLVGDGGNQHALVGEAVHVAGHLESVAEPNTVVIEASTRRLIGRLFDCDDLGEVTTRSGSEPTRMWRVLGTSALDSRFEALRAASTPLVGREEELELLLRRWRHAARGNGQVVLLSGEAGIGKSRLTVALQEQIQLLTHTQLRAFCSPHHRDSTLYPSIGQLERAAGFQRDDAGPQRLEKLEALLAQSGDALNDDICLIADLLSVPTGERYPPVSFSPQKRKEKTLRALLAQIEGLAARQPVLMVCEDAHWADPTSLELLDLLIDRLPALAVSLIITFRPEFKPPWIGRPHVTLLTLNRLSPGHCAEMIAGVTDGRTLPKDIVDQIIERTDGVPLFVEELTKTVVESGIVVEAGDRYMLKEPLRTLAIPTTLQASLLARLDRLPATREVAQIGAALGRSFSHEVISAVAQLPPKQLDDALTRLVSAELIYRRGAAPDAEYTFKHSLVQDAAHATLLRGPRQQLHRRIAETLERQFPEMVTTQPEVLARHCTEAGMVEKAVGYWLKAGRRAFARSATTETAARLHKGLSLLSDLPDSEARHEFELDLQTVLGHVLLVTKGFAAPQPSAAFARARELFEQLGRPPKLGILAGQFWISYVHAELEQAERHAVQICQLGEQLNSMRWKRIGWKISGLVSLFLGRFTDARAYYENWLSLDDPTDPARVSGDAADDWYIVSLPNFARSLLCLGYLDQARSWRSKALAEARRRAPFNVIATLLHTSINDWLIDGPKSADTTLRSAEEILVLSREYGFALYVGLGTIMRGFGIAMTAEPADGIELILEGLALYRDTGNEIVVPFCLIWLAEACARARQPEEGFNRLTDALNLVETTKERWVEAELHRVRGDLLIAIGDRASAETSYRQALSIARQQDARLFELRAATGLAKLWRDQGKEAEARELLAPVCGWFTEGFDAPVLAEAKELLEQLSAASKPQRRKYAPPASLRPGVPDC
jgi:TolB-like protein/tetratricopeptide (TPR) repeat protein